MERIAIPAASAAEILAVFAEAGWAEGGPTEDFAGSERCRYADLPAGRHIARDWPNHPEPVTVFRMELGEEGPVKRLRTVADARAWLAEEA